MKGVLLAPDSVYSHEVHVKMDAFRYTVDIKSS